PRRHARRGVVGAGSPRWRRPDPRRGPRRAHRPRADLGRGGPGRRVMAATPRPTLRFRVVAWVVIALVRVLRWRLRTTGLRHVPREGGAVITWNHHGHIDFVLTAWDLYRRLGRPVRYLAMRELWSSPTLGWVPRFADAIPVTRTSEGDRDRALADAVHALRDGHLGMVA